MESAMKLMLRVASMLLLSLLPLVAAAADGYVTATVNLRTGPDTSFPAVTVLPEGMPVSVQGCVDGYAWCDVIADNERGWVSGQYLAFNYDNTPVYINHYGPRLGIPIVVFNAGMYWDNYYRSRPWYSHRSRWVNWRPPVWRPLPPRPPGFGPPPRPHPPGWRPPGWRPNPPGGTRPPPRPNPPIGTRPPPRPNPPGGTRPPPRPNPADGNRPNPGGPGGGIRPQPRPNPGGNRPNPGDSRPPGNTRPQTRPAPVDKTRDKQD